jgi:predicted ribosomally synthesized peptide with nif11-like leader
MATPRAAELIAKISDDVVFRQRLENAGTPEARRQIFDEAGYADVTKEDLTQALQEGSPDGELSDAELEAVAGGATTQWLSIIVALAVAA